MDIDALERAWRSRGARRLISRHARAERARESARRVAAVLRDEFGVEEVWLFGSLAGEPTHDDFDIDLAVRGLPPGRYFQALARVSDIATESVDLVPLEAADERLESRVTAAGRRIDHG